MPAVLTGATTAGGFLLVLAIALPFAGILLAVLLGGRAAERVALATLAAGVVVALAVAIRVWDGGVPVVYLLGDWPPPLGVAIRADGPAAAMLVTSAVLAAAIGIYARTPFATPAGVNEARAPYAFWVLLPALLGALNTAFLGEDLFNLYVALELLTFAAVPLVCLDGKRATLVAALRYLLFALLGSILYLLGAALMYGRYGTLDIAELALRVRPGAATWLPIVLMTAGLLAKTALFPLHLWLPPAHAGAPPAASALLSGLVVKAPFILVLRLWFDVMGGVPAGYGPSVLGTLGAGAILVGSTVALRQERLKLLIAYSTIAQIGYLFLVFPLADGDGGPPGLWQAHAWNGGLLQALSHAFAKAGMFLAAGLIAEALGSDRIDGLRGAAATVPVTVAALAIASLSLLGLPASGGFVAKWLLISAAVRTGQWGWGAVMLAGGLLAGGYLYRVLAPAFTGMAEPPVPRARIARGRELVALGLALGALVLGMVPLGLDRLLTIGHPAFQAALQ